MHRIDTPDAVSGLFDPGDPLVPREPTAVDVPWLNTIQEEIAKTVEGAGLTLRASGAADEGASYASQLLEAIKKLNPVKAWVHGHVQVDASGNISSPVIDAQSGVTGAAVTAGNQLDLTVPGVPNGLLAVSVTTHQLPPPAAHGCAMHPLPGVSGGIVSLTVVGVGPVSQVHFTALIVW